MGFQRWSQFRSLSFKDVSCSSQFHSCLSHVHPCMDGQFFPFFRCEKTTPSASNKNPPQNNSAPKKRCQCFSSFSFFSKSLPLPIIFFQKKSPTKMQKCKFAKSTPLSFFAQIEVDSNPHLRTLALYWRAYLWGMLGRPSTLDLI